jgi:2-polyprenyl-3-methyl-5-hydroxy-6-metoxy-1,4-benzoquinol methylase
MTRIRRHTKRDLVRLFRRRGLRAKRQLGQHFLIDHNVLDVICRTARLAPDDVVLEIGAGTGLLTEHLAASGAHVPAAVAHERGSRGAQDPGSLLVGGASQRGVRHLP